MTRMPGTRDTTPNWQDLLKHPDGGDHFVQFYQDKSFLADAVAAYVGAGLREGEAAVVIATPEHAQIFLRELEARGLYPQQALRRDQLRLLDAEDTLARFMVNGSCDWQAFHELEVGGVIVNDVPTYRIDHMPYGGVKDSGLGREGLRWAIEDMTEIRIMVMAQAQ